MVKLSQTTALRLTSDRFTTRKRPLYDSQVTLLKMYAFSVWLFI